MRRILVTLVSAIAICSFVTAQEVEEAVVQLAEPFDSPYTGDDASGDHVIALWQFDPGAETQDASGNGHDIELRGAEFVAEGKFGGALESSRGWPDEDTPHQAVVKQHPSLSPKGAFTIEMWIAAKPELEGYPEAFLLDSRYVDNSGYQLTLSPESGMGTRQLSMRLGFGADIAQYNSRAFAYEPGVWHHIAFTYDGAGMGRFFIDGTAQGSESHPERGAIAPAQKRLIIASLGHEDRIRSAAQHQPHSLLEPLQGP